MANELDRDDLIVNAYKAARQLFPNATKEQIEFQTVALANQGAEHVNRILGQESRGVGLPSVGLTTRQKPEVSEEQALEMIEKMTPDQRRTLKHIKLMRAKNQVPYIKGDPLY
ncbi:TPA_asm: hypothetical protein vir520_00057 [Caudoviricetes sp. vir520]|nr:TPA_asm: hypothetical protein vir520_00057 [Caudoviricetes sp. vir520]